MQQIKHRYLRILWISNSEVGTHQVLHVCRTGEKEQGDVILAERFSSLYSRELQGLEISDLTPKKVGSIYWLKIRYSFCKIFYFMFKDLYIFVFVYLSFYLFVYLYAYVCMHA